MIKSNKTVISNMKYQEEKEVYIHYNSHNILPNGDVLYDVTEWFIKDGIKEFISNYQKIRTFDEVNQTTAYIVDNYSDLLSGLTEQEKSFKIIQIGFYLNIMTDLLPNGTTIFGLTPADWEMTVL